MEISVNIAIFAFEKNLFEMNACTNYSRYKYLTSGAQLLLGVVFMISGFVKGVDPHGTEYKIIDYLQAWDLQSIFPSRFALFGSICLSMGEFLIGVCLVLQLYTRIASLCCLAFMLVMTPLTFWLALYDPVSDCGCFGDAIVLSNWQTFWKNVLLLSLAISVTLSTFRNHKEHETQTSRFRWTMSILLILFMGVIEWWGLYYLPIIDFRPYHIGANIKEGMTIPDDAPRDVYRSTFILEKEGVRKEFTLEDYPDSTWTYIDSKIELLEKGYEAPIHDFAIKRISNHKDITEYVLSKEDILLLISTDLSQIHADYNAQIKLLAELCMSKGIELIMLTASTSEAAASWKKSLSTDYIIIANTDQTTLKTMIRSNPGIMRLQKGFIVGKWSRKEISSCLK